MPDIPHLEQLNNSKSLFIDRYDLKEILLQNPIWVRLNMVSSLDGSVVFNGKSGELGNKADQELLVTLRLFADVIVIGSSTFKAEGYGPINLREEFRQVRISRGMAELPKFAIVTNRGALDFENEIFSNSSRKPIIITTEQALDHGSNELANYSDLLVCGQVTVDPRLIIEKFGALGLKSVLLEGGPRLNSSFLKANSINEICLTLSPALAGKQDSSIFGNAELENLVKLHLVSVIEDDGFLFLRYFVS